MDRHTDKFRERHRQKEQDIKRLFQGIGWPILDRIQQVKSYRSVFKVIKLFSFVTSRLSLANFIQASLIFEG
jgi:hypothetical protein